MHVPLIPELAEALLATGFPSRKRHDSPNVHFYHEFTLRSHGVRRAGSAALDLAYVASGRLDAFWEFNLNPWDTAAGILLVEEAGAASRIFPAIRIARQPRDTGLQRQDSERTRRAVREHVCRPRPDAHSDAARSCNAARGEEKVDEFANCEFLSCRNAGK